jgi:hypothetical protein
MITRTDKKLKISLNPRDPASREFLLRAKSGTATMMLLYDSFFRLADVLAKSKKLRRIIEVDMAHEGTALENTYELALNGELWDKSTHSVKFLSKAKALISSQDDTEDLIFDQYLAKSFVAQKMLEGDLDFRLKRILFLEGQLGQGRFFDKIYTFMGLLSKFFGNTAGLFQTRSGKLKHLVKNPQDLNSMKSKLKPLSILVEKTPFRLTDHFIPGYFGHVAIWLGTIDELKPLKVPLNGKSIPLLNHPDVLPHLKQISEGRSILEAVRLSGVSLNSVENFLDIDDLVIMEGTSMSQDEQALHLLRAFQQIGKPYDFNFNVESEREIICSELVYMVFLNEIWPTSRSAGRFTISPDQVAWRGVDSCFHPVLMYLSGKKVE